MKIRDIIGLAAVSLSIGLGACKPAENTVEYKEAANYFVRNDVKEYRPMLIQSQEEFKGIFGMAPVMGKDGRPTEIDFSKENVIALISEPTNRMSKIDILSIRKENGQLTVRYKILSTGDQMTFYITPCRLLIIDKTAGSEVRFVEEQ